MRQRIREMIVKLVRDEFIAYLEAREDVLMRIFREEMDQVNQRLNHHSYIHVQLEVVGEHLVGAILRTIKRFLMETSG